MRKVELGPFHFPLIKVHPLLLQQLNFQPFVSACSNEQNQFLQVFKWILKYTKWVWCHSKCLTWQMCDKNPLGQHLHPGGDRAPSGGGGESKTIYECELLLLCGDHRDYAVTDLYYILIRLRRDVVISSWPSSPERPESAISSFHPLVWWRGGEVVSYSPVWKWLCLTIIRSCAIKWLGFLRSPFLCPS